MYKERTEDFTSWRDLFIQFLFVTLFIFILFWLFPTKSYLDEKIDSLYQSNFAENVDRMSVAAQHYFINPRLPQENGVTFKLTLQEMYDLKIILPVKDHRGNSCNANLSYVEITKVDSEHYLLKVFLSCPEMEDYIFVHLGCYDYCEMDICEEVEPTKPVVTPDKPKPPTPPKPPKPVVLPTAPAVSCSVQSTTQINVSWNAVDKATEYKIYRCSGASCTPITNVRNQAGTLWANTGLNEGTTYRYRVKSSNSAGDSAYSNIATCKTPSTEQPPQVPQAPTVSCSVQSTSQINVSWNAVNYASGYKVFRCTGSSCTPTLMVRDQVGTSWGNTGLNEETTYRYRVKAYNANGESNYSNTVTCTTPSTEQPPQVPQAPTVMCNVQSTSQIDVSWNAVNYALGYKVFRCTGTSCVPIIEVRNQSNTYWSNTGLQAETAYRYRVKAYNNSGESNYSNTVTCSTPIVSVDYEYEYQRTDVTEQTVWGNWSGWSTSSVSSGPLTQVDTKDEQQLINNGFVWGNWSAWSLSVVSASSTRQVEVKDETTYETKREQILVGYENKIVTETKRVKVGEVATIQCTQWSGSSVTTRTYWQESSSSPRVFGYIPQDTSTTIYVLTSVPTDGYDCSSTSCVVKKGVYRVFERKTQTTSSGSNVCVSYSFSKQSVYGDKLVSYNVQTPIYGWVDKQYPVVKKYYRFRDGYEDKRYVAVRYYRYKNGQVIRDTNVVTRWSTSPNDQALINQGFQATGNKKVK